MDAVRWAWRTGVLNFLTISMTCRILLQALSEPHLLQNAIDVGTILILLQQLFA